MKYVKTFESYLKGGRAPLYHFTGSNHITDILKDDELKMSIPSVDKNGRRRGHKDVIKSVSLSRFYSLVEILNSVRIVLNSDLLIRNGYVPKPSYELGYSNFKSPSLRKFISNQGALKIQHGIKVKGFNQNSKMEQEYEERVYKNIENLGKYIIYIDVNEIKLSRFSDIMEYIKKYPHIQVRKLEYHNLNFAGQKKSVIKSPNCKEILMDIDIINKEEKERVSVINR